MEKQQDSIVYVNTVHSDQVEGMGYAKFNPGPHLCVDVSGNATISVNLPDGKQVTFAFIPDGDPKTTNSHECCDVCVIHDRLQVEYNPGSPFGDDRTGPLQKGIMFHGGCKTERLEGTLLTTLLSNEHLDTSKSGYGVQEDQTNE